MVLSISGLGSQLSLNLIDSTKDRQIETMKSEAEHARLADAFRERIGSITSVEELTDDFEVYSFVMKAYDLEDQIFGRAMMERILTSDADDDDSLLNNLSNANFDDLHEALGFNTEGVPSTQDFNSTLWQDEIVDKYFETTFRLEYNEMNETVGTTLEFREKLGEIDTWYNVLADAELGEFFRTALGLPESMGLLDVDQQVSIFENKYDLTLLNDPDEVQSLETRYVAISDVLNPPSAASNSIVQLVSGATGQFVPITIDIPSLNFSSASLYRF